MLCGLGGPWAVQRFPIECTVSECDLSLSLPNIAYGLLAMSVPEIVLESGFPFHCICARTRVGIAGIGAIFILKYSPIEL